MNLGGEIIAGAAAWMVRRVGTLLSKLANLYSGVTRAPASPIWFW
jgi:hypothetical protein